MKLRDSWRRSVHGLVPEAARPQEGEAQELAVSAPIEGSGRRRGGGWARLGSESRGPKHLKP